MQNLTNLTRRAAIALLGAGGSAVAVPVLAVAANKIEEATAADRMAYHLAEFQRAAQEVDPRICDWTAEHGDDLDQDLYSDRGSVIRISALRRLPPKFQGDGTYLVERRGRREATIRVDPMRDAQSRFHVVVMNGPIRSDEFWTSEAMLSGMIISKLG